MNTITLLAQLNENEVVIGDFTLASVQHLIDLLQRHGLMDDAGAMWTVTDVFVDIGSATPNITLDCKEQDEP